MARIDHVNPDGVVVRLTGWTALAALRREVRVPMRAIRSISTGRYGATGFRVADTAIGASPRDSVEADRLRRDPEDHALGRDRRVVVVLGAVLPRERVDVGASLLAAYGRDDLAADLGVRVRVVPLPDR